MLDVNGHSIYFQAERCNLRRLAAVRTWTGPPVPIASTGRPAGHRGLIGVGMCVCCGCVQEGRKRTWTPEPSDMSGICHLWSHGGIYCAGPRTGQDFPTVREVPERGREGGRHEGETEQHFLFRHSPCRIINTNGNKNSNTENSTQSQNKTESQSNPSELIPSVLITFTCCCIIMIII